VKTAKNKLNERREKSEAKGFIKVEKMDYDK